jgi:hypothetical protein
MMVIFEVFLAPDADPESLLTEEQRRETQAQVMTPDEAQKVGFANIPASPGKEVCLIAVAKRDAGWIHRSLEANDAVGSFRIHDVD